MRVYIEAVGIRRAFLTYKCMTALFLLGLRNAFDIYVNLFSLNLWFLYQNQSQSPTWASVLRTFRHVKNRTPITSETLQLMRDARNLSSVSAYTKTAIRNRRTTSVPVGVSIRCRLRNFRC